MKSALETVLKNNLIKENDNVGVAVSGGSDSIALLHFLFDLQKKLKFNLVCLHVDHNLRKTSKRDANFVQDECKKLGVKCFVASVDVKTFCSLNNCGAEEGARILRYKFFEQVKKEQNLTKIALAHHMLDQIETILLHLFRGSGLSGAIGMKLKREFYIRPFLFTSKDEILNYIEKNNLKFMNDETNDCINYSRNFLRKEIIPKLKEKFNGIEKNLVQFSINADIDEKFLKSCVDLSKIQVIDGDVKIDVNYLANLDRAISVRAIKIALEKLGVFCDIGEIHYSLILDLLNKQNGSKINLPNKIVAIKDYNSIVFANEKDENVMQDLPLKLGKMKFKDFGEVEFKLCKNLKECDSARHILDYDKLPKKVCIRSRRNGDKFKKFGSGDKNLKEFFINRKISERKRNSIPLIAKDNVIYVVIGEEISDYVKFDSGTKNFLAIYTKF